MTKKSTMTELRKMQHLDLEREVTVKHALIAKIRLGVEMVHEKDTAKLRREKKELARLFTALREKTLPRASSLNGSQKEATMPAPKKKSSTPTS